MTPHPWPAEPVSDGFDFPKLAHCWNHLRNPDPNHYSLTERPGSLRLACGKPNLDDLDSPSFVGRRQEHLSCEVSTLIEFTPASDNEEAGLTVLADNRHHCELAITLLGGKRCAIVRRRIGSLSAEVACEELPDGAVELAIRTDKTTYHFLAGAPGSLKELAAAEARYVSTQVAGGYTGVYFGLYATANGEESSSKAFFEKFDYRGI
jgi:alpha-N-arabinofuranosidase